MPHKQKVLSYTAGFEPLENGGYLVTVPALPGLVTDGVDFDDAVAMAKDAMAGHLAALAALGEPIPAEAQAIQGAEGSARQRFLSLPEDQVRIS